MKSGIISILLAAVITTGSGCATIVTGGRPDQKVRFSSEPDGATIYVDGSVIGKTPLSQPLKRDMNHHVKMTLAGYPSYEKDLKTGFNGWVLGNIIIGGLIGIGIDLISGSTDALDPSSVSVNFTELKENEFKEAQKAKTEHLRK